MSAERDEWKARAEQAEARLAKVLAKVQARLSDPVYVFAEGEDCIRTADVRAVLDEAAS